MEEKAPPDDEGGKPNKISTEYVDYSLTASAKARQAAVRKEALLPMRSSGGARKTVQFDSREQVIETTVTPLEVRSPALDQESSRSSSAELGNSTITKLPLLDPSKFKKPLTEKGVSLAAASKTKAVKKPVKATAPAFGSTTSIEEKMSQTIRVKKGDRSLVRKEHSLVPDIYSKSAIDKFIEDDRIEFNRRGAYTDKFHLNYIKLVLEAFEAQQRKPVEMRFDGVEVTTDLVFYVLYRFYRESGMLSELATVNIDSCRFVTDFGIELLSYAANKPQLVKKSHCIGCSEIYKYKYQDVELDLSIKDIFAAPLFNHLQDVRTEAGQQEDNAVELNVCKIEILNGAKLSLTKFMQNQLVIRESAAIISYGQVRLDAGKDQDGHDKAAYKYNVVEINANYPFVFNTPSSILMICLELASDTDVDRALLVSQLANKLMQAFNKGLDYLDIVLAIDNGSAAVDTQALLLAVGDHLRSVANKIQEEETRLLPDLESLATANIGFYDQEKLRNQIRLRFAIDRFLSASYQSHIKVVLLDGLTAETHESLMNVLRGLRRERQEIIYFAEMSILIRQKKYMKRVVRIEDFIDDMYSRSSKIGQRDERTHEVHSSYKLIMQTQERFSNMCEDFFRFKYYLGECLFITLPNNQTFVIFDQDWFFQIVRKVLGDGLKATRLQYDHLLNMSSLGYEATASAGFMDELKIANQQQVEYVLQIIVGLDLLMETSAGSTRRLVVPNVFQAHKSEIDLATVWSKNLSGSYQVSLFYEFPFTLPTCILVRLLSSFLGLFEVDYLTEDFLLFQEGSFNILLYYNKAKNELELSVRTVDFAKILDNSGQLKDLQHFKKSILCLYNEYMIVLECGLFDIGIPFSVAKKPNSSLTFDPTLKVYKNFECQLEHLLLDPQAKPEEFLPIEHCFKPVNTFNAELSFLRCKHCQVSDTWHQAVYDSYRRMHPMTQSEKDWKLNVLYKGIASNDIKPEKKSLLSIFRVGTERIKFFGLNTMSPFYFDNYSLTLVSVAVTDSIRVGFQIENREKNERQTIYLNAKTRRLNIENERLDTGEALEAGFINSQRYTKEYRNKVLRLPNQVRASQSDGITVEQKNAYANLMESIKALRGKNDRKATSSEEWVVKAGDELAVKLVVGTQEKNTCDVGFYYNKEKVGTFTVQELSSVRIFPYTEVGSAEVTTSSSTKFFFNMGSSRFKSILANEFAFKEGMCLEVERVHSADQLGEGKLEYYAEENERELTYLAPAVIKSVNSESGELELALLGAAPGTPSFWLEPTSPDLHPCGYWQYLRTHSEADADANLAVQKMLREFDKVRAVQEFRVPAELLLACQDEQKRFSWQKFFEQNASSLIAGHKLFNAEQLNEMPEEAVVSCVAPSKNLLTCNFKYNPRYSWTALEQLNMDDMSEIYREIGIISNHEDMVDRYSKVTKSAMVLMPKTIDKDFIFYPNVKNVNDVSFLHVSCTHRQDIKLYIGRRDYISNKFPHLLLGAPFDLSKSKAKLSFLDMLVVMCTCYDICQSDNEPLYPGFQLDVDIQEATVKTLSRSLRDFFNQIVHSICMLMPIFYDNRFRLSHQHSLKELLLTACDDCLKQTQLSSDNASELEAYVQRSVEGFGINSNGLCKYCSALHVKLGEGATSKSLEPFLLKVVDDKEFAQIVTSIKLHSGGVLQRGADSWPHMALGRQFLENLTNLADISIKNIAIDHIDEFVTQCKSLKNMQLVRNNLSQLSPNLFTMTSGLSQIRIDNNPLLDIPASLFSMQSLRSLSLSRLNITSLPDTWLQNLEGNETSIGIRSLYISQTRLNTLPKDLLAGNISLEALTFQGVSLILPDNENQWYTFMITPEKLVELYCPVLMSEREARALFSKFDQSNNNLLDYIELQSLNAYIFKMFPRLGDGSKANDAPLLPEAPKDSDENNATIGHKKEAVESKSKHLRNFSNTMSSIYRCVSLQYLDLSFQAIKKIPSAIKTLKNLKVLKLRYCVYLSTLSSSLGQLKLDELDLTGCISLRTPPLEIQRRGVASVLAFLNRLSSASVGCKRTKLMLQGLGGAGKTSLMEALIHKIYQNDDKPPPNVTDGITICDWNVPLENIKPAEDADENVATAAAGAGVGEPSQKSKKKKERAEGQTRESLTFSVFDFAGQTVYYNTHQYFLTQRSVYLLVWNVRLGAEHSGLDFWLNSIDCHAPFCPIFVIGTHVDEVKKYGLETQKLKKRYPQIVGFYYVSSRTGLGIDELSKAIVDAALKEKYMGEKIPKCWLDLENALKELKLTKNIVDYSEIEKLAQDFGIFDKLELSQVVQFLHDLGSLMHFNNEFLRNKVIINPQYMVDLMACLVSVNNNLIVDGRLMHADLARIWAKYDPKLHPWIVRLTEKFDLTFSVPQQAMNLVPCLMPDQAPGGEFRWPESQLADVKETQIVYDFEYLPAGLFNRAQVRLFQLTNNELIWKNGSLLNKNKHLALVTRHDNQIRVRVQGVQPENIVFLIHEVIEVLITESFNGVDYDVSFPCPECFAKNSINTEGMASMFSAELVRRAANRKTPFLQCRHHFHVTPLVDLHALMPASDSTDNYDLQLKNSVRDLKHLKQKLTFDVVIIYSVKDALDTSTIHPRQIHADLERHELNCWFTEAPDAADLEQMAIVLRNASIVLYCISNNFAADPRCIQMFDYARNVLNKSHLLVVLGQSFDWQKTNVGAQITDELFIKVNTIARYETSMPDMVSLAKKKIQASSHRSAAGRKPAVKQAHDVFLSYCRVNSRDAIDKGTPLKSPDSLGWGDPRELKTFLEKNDYSVWVDFEQVGAKKTLFEDIAEGIRNSKIVVACVSNEYSRSENCLREFRFAQSLKIPIVMCTFGSADVKCEWRSTELGILSVLMNKEINFQLENPSAFSSMLAEIQLHQVKPSLQAKKKPVQKQFTFEQTVAKPNEPKMEAYAELIELAQRKFLRQIQTFSDGVSSRPFPRLFAVDLPAKADADTAGLNETIGRKKRDAAAAGSLCLRALCEHENSWHASGSPVDYELLTSIPQSHFPYVLRIMSLIKQSDVRLDIVAHMDTLDELMDHIDESLPDSAPLAFTFKDSFHSLKSYILEKLEKIKMQKSSRGKQMAGSQITEPKPKNINRVEHFKLNRCAMQSGRILWLCDEHSQADNIQVLSETEDVSIVQYQTDEFNMILLDELKKYDAAHKTKTTT